MYSTHQQHQSLYGAAPLNQSFGQTESDWPSSAAPTDTAAHPEALAGYPDKVYWGAEGQIETLYGLDDAGMDARAPIEARRFSEGDQHIYPAAYATIPPNYSTPAAPAPPDLFDSAYTLAPAPLSFAPPAAPSSSAPFEVPLHQTPQPPSFSASPSPYSHTPFSSTVPPPPQEQTHADYSVFPAMEVGDYYDSMSSMGTYEFPKSQPAHLGDPFAAMKAAPRSAESYAVNVVATTSAYSTGVYSTSSASAYPISGQDDAGQASSRDRAHSTSMPIQETLYCPPSSSSFLPSPFSHSASAPNSAHQTPYYSPTISFQPAAPLASSSTHSPTTRAHSQSSSRRSSIAPASSAPSLVDLPTRHHSFSGPSSSASPAISNELHRSSLHPSARDNLCASQSFSPYPPPQQPRRRASQPTLGSSPIAAPPFPQTPPSATPSRRRPAPLDLQSTPRRLAGTHTPQQGSPTSKSVPSPARSTPRRPNPGLALSVDTGAAAGFGTGLMSFPSSGATTPYDREPLASPLGVSRKRRCSADVAPLPLSASACAGSSLAGFAGAGGVRHQSSFESLASSGVSGNEGYLHSMVEEREDDYSSGSGGGMMDWGPYGGWDGALASMDPAGQVGLGLAMGVEEMHLAADPSVTGAPSFSSQPYPFYSTQAPAPMPYAPSTQMLQLDYERSAEEARAMRDEEIRQYLRAENKLDVGERTVLVLNPRIAQRSYGTEKRLLAPPPMALLLGSSWWSILSSHPDLLLAASRSGKLPSPPSPLSPVTLPPDIFISISTDTVPPKSAATTSWMALDGRNVLECDGEEAPPVAGRAVSKSLAVQLPGELNKDVSTTVRTVVTVVAPGVGPVAPRIIGMFPGKPMTVISKPSKKRAIAAGATAGLTHGSLVALYNRTKTYTGSTRYLCTSGVQSNFPTMDWRTMTGDAHRPFAPNDSHDVRFVSKTNAWDAFVIYAVDVTLPTDGENVVQLPAPQPGFPRPPVNVIPFDPRNPKALYYNQTVVLQCLATAVVSPVLIIRRVDPKALAVGGGSIDGNSPSPKDVEGIPAAPGERLGEPVSQYKPIAFEVLQDVSKYRSEDPFDRPMPENTFLGVVDDEIGIHIAEEAKTFVQTDKEPSQPLTPTTPSSSLPRASVNDLLPAPWPNALQQSGSDLMDLGSSYISPHVDSSSDEAKVKRARRTSSSTTVPTVPSPYAQSSRSMSALAKNRRRGQSMSSLAQLQGLGSAQAGSKVWTVPCGDHCVWSIVSIDLARHTFYVPPSLEGGRAPMINSHSRHSTLYTTPVPSNYIGPAVPTFTKCQSPRAGAPADSEASYVALHGENLDPTLSIWLGEQPCTSQIFKSPQLLLFRPPPPPIEEVVSNRRIVLVRSDGVVFPTSIYYRDRTSS
ncbi:hypothetical protein JCM1840_000867 [Sporobolomyces johnsonii]